MEKLLKSESIIKIFKDAIQKYHIKDDINQNMPELNDEFEISKMLFHKCWIDTIQWHLEDLIRDPEIDPSKALEIKRHIDKSNQHRTDLVEEIDSKVIAQLKPAEQIPDHIPYNTESPGWAIDRLSILELKIYHMQEQANRLDSSEEFISEMKQKLYVLHIQERYLSMAIDTLFEEIKEGKRQTIPYVQMKMYNDKRLNPILYTNQSTR
jgi:hypothetical protein